MEFVNVVNYIVFMSDLNKNTHNQITEQDIKELPTVARRMLHNFRVAYKNESQRLNDAHESRVSQYKKREQQIESLERDFARRQAEFASIIEDPRIKEALKQDESEMPDIMSEDGIQARINRGVAEAVSSVFEPMQEISSKRRQESAYFDFLEAKTMLFDRSGFLRRCN